MTLPGTIEWLLTLLLGKFVRIAHNEVSISDPEAVREVLQSSMDKLCIQGPSQTRRPMLTSTQADWYKIFSLPDSRYANTMSETDDKEMVRRTSNVAVGYSLSSLLKGESHIDACIALLREQLSKPIKSALAGGVHLDKWINYLAFDIVGEATFSK